jgi:hypothetical protein
VAVFTSVGRADYCRTGWGLVKVGAFDTQTIRNGNDVTETGGPVKDGRRDASEDFEVVPQSIWKSWQFLLLLGGGASIVLGLASDILLRASLSSEGYSVPTLVVLASLALASLGGVIVVVAALVQRQKEEWEGWIAWLLLISPLAALSPGQSTGLSRAGYSEWTSILLSILLNTALSILVLTGALFVCRYRQKRSEPQPRANIVTEPPAGSGVTRDD